MAKATVKKKVIIEEVNLKLSKEEAETLADLIYAGVGGNSQGRRKHLTAIEKALDLAGIEGDDDRSDDISGYLTIE